MTTVDVDEIQRESPHQYIRKTFRRPLFIIAGPGCGQVRKRGQISHITPQSEYFFFWRPTHCLGSFGTPGPGSRSYRSANFAPACKYQSTRTSPEARRLKISISISGLGGN